MRLTKISLAVIAFLFIASPARAIDLPKIHGFVEGAYGFRTRHNDTTKHNTYNFCEQRIQLKSNYAPNLPILRDMYTEFNYKGDLIIDEYDQGNVSYDIREANLSFSPLDWMDVKLGRQIFTWGTGDYLFVNDVFPKDYVSFFIGRNDEYLKKPSDGVKISGFNKLVNADFILMPFFEANTTAQGDRLSFYDMFQSGIAGRESDRALREPSLKPNNSELAGRLYRNFGSYETALYTFKGHYRNPIGTKMETRRVLFYPRLNVYGGSIRGPALGGIGNIELGYYDSTKDRRGRKRHIPNSTLRWFVGYEKDLGDDLRVGLQYYYEHMMHYGRYKDSRLAADPVNEEINHRITLRITKLAMNQTFRATFFVFYSPVEEDFYIRPVGEYDITDQWKLTLGVNIIWGEENNSEFGQMRKNSNIYARLRYSF